MTTYIFLWSNTHPLYFMWANLNSYVTNRDIPFNDGTHAIQVAHGNKLACYMGAEEFAHDVENGKRFFDPAFARQYLTDARKQCALHQEFFARCRSTDFSTLSNQDLVPMWQELMDQYGRSAGYFRGSQDEPTRALVESVTAKTSPEETSILLISPKLDLINQETIAWSKILETGFSREKAASHLMSYPWLLQNVYSYEQAIDELEHRASFPGDPHDMQAEKEQLRGKQEELLAKYPDLRHAVETLQELALLRTEVKACWAATEYHALPLLETLAERSGVDRNVLMSSYRHEDVIQLLNEGIALSDADLAARKLCTMQIYEDGVFRSLVGEEAQTLVEQKLPDVYGNREAVTELKGTPARPGKVQGTVHILTVNDPQKAQEFRESFSGGVLVTSMTQPNVVDIVRRASAVVTDEGSMLSHAAIISREFGIPCIVGTKKATQVLKDGDLVEVDADTGMVHILERA